MVDDEGFELGENKIIVGGIVLFFVFVGLIGFGVFSFGANSMCEEVGGVVLKGVDGYRCVNISNIDLCLDEGKNSVMDKPGNDFNFSINWSGN